jgi:hypothetical protein
MDFNTMMAVLITCGVWILVLIIVTFCVLLFRFMKRKYNPLDFVIMDIVKNSYTVEFAVGRKINDPVKGTRFVTCGFFPFSIGFDLGYNIVESEALPSRNYARRKVFIVAREGNIATQMNLLHRKKDLTDAQKDILRKAEELLGLQHITQEYVNSINLTPLLSENTRVALDTQALAYEIHEKDQQAGTFRWSMIISAIIFIITLIAGGFVIVYAFNASPDIVSRVATEVGNKIATGIVTGLSNTTGVPVG